MEKLKRKVSVVVLCLAIVSSSWPFGGGVGVCFAGEFSNSGEGKAGASASKEEERERFALVIGNAKYNDVPELSNPLNDTKDMNKALKRLGFKVTHLLDIASRRKMTEAVRKFGDQLAQSANAIGLFFYAGHAIQINGVNYLIPVKADIRVEADVEFETFDVNYLLRTMSQAKNCMNIVILDACRNNPFARGFRGTWGRGLATMRSPTGSTIVFATSPGENAEDGSGRNGTFTKHLLEHIETPNLTIEQMLKRVRLGVHDETKGQQIPWMESSQLGDFCFAGCLDQAAMELESRRLAEEKLKAKIAEEQERHDRELSAMLAERLSLEKKMIEGVGKPQDAESLEKIKKEQAALAEQRKLLKEEQDRINKQKEQLAQQKKTSSGLKEEISRLKKEQEKFEEERKKIVHAQPEPKDKSLPAKQAQKVEITTGVKTVKPIMPSIGF